MKIYLLESQTTIKHILIKILFGMTLMIPFFTETSWATTNLQEVADAPPNNCVYLSVMINNNTKTTCELVNKEVIYGRMSSSTQVPVLIPPGTSSYPFEMRQVLYGPDIVLTYECGAGRKITIESQQDFCALNSGEVSGKILFATNLSARSIRDRGSYFWNRHGSISWTLYTPN